mmetsp:Transcript_17775/g.42567  ORF Transcript_17775/g.42567 Transcript_17775/m.42567 type:complete len:201 (+) Transcript_17775:526-1128(+)
MLPGVESKVRWSAASRGDAVAPVFAREVVHTDREVRGAPLPLGHIHVREAAAAGRVVVVPRTVDGHHGLASIHGGGGGAPLHAVAPVLPRQVVHTHRPVRGAALRLGHEDVLIAAAAGGRVEVGGAVDRRRRRVLQRQVGAAEDVVPRALRVLRLDGAATRAEPPAHLAVVGAAAGEDVRPAHDEHAVREDTQQLARREL